MTCSPVTMLSRCCPGRAMSRCAVLQPRDRQDNTGTTKRVRCGVVLCVNMLLNASFGRGWRLPPPQPCPRSRGSVTGSVGETVEANDNPQLEPNSSDGAVGSTTNLSLLAVHEWPTLLVVSICSPQPCRRVRRKRKQIGWAGRGRIDQRSGQPLDPWHSGSRRYFNEETGMIASA